MSTSNHSGDGQLCLVTAADIEFDHIAKALRSPLIERELGTRLCRANLSRKQGRRPIVVLQSEMGAPDFTERLRRHLALFPYEGLIILGLGGGLSPELKTGDVVLYEHCLNAADIETVAKKPTVRDQIASIPCDYEFLNQIEKACLGLRISAKRSIGACTRHVLSQASEKSALHIQTGAGVVDMESWPVMDALRELKMPVAVCRVIVDEAEHDLPEFNAGLRADGTYDAVKMLLVMLARPVTSARFLWNLKRATHSLRRLTTALCKL